MRDELLGFFCLRSKVWSQSTLQFTIFILTGFLLRAAPSSGQVCTQPDQTQAIHNDSVSAFGQGLSLGVIREASDIENSPAWETNARVDDFICLQTALNGEVCFPIVANYLITINNVDGCDGGPCPGTGIFNEYVVLADLTMAGVAAGNLFVLYPPVPCISPPPAGADDEGDTPPPPPPPGVQHTQRGCGGAPVASPSASKATGSCSHEILVDRGEERYIVTDLKIPGRGLHWEHTRVYRSRRSFNSPMGYNWSHPYFDYLLVRPDNSVRGFNGPEPGENARFDDWATVGKTYQPPRGFFSTLVQENSTKVGGGGSAMNFTLLSRDGTRREYGQQVGAAVYLTAMEDRFGNRMLFFYEDPQRPHLLTRVKDTLGRSIHYAYYGEDPARPGREDRLSTITDFLGRVLTFDYDDEGNLIEASSPAVMGTVTDNDFAFGKKETYTYSSGAKDPALNHNLLSVVRPNENSAEFGLPEEGTPVLQWTYDTQDRVVTHTIGTASGPNNMDGGAGGTVIYSYEENPLVPKDFDPSFEDSASAKTIETDRNGNVRVYWLDALGNIVRFEHFTRGLRPNEPEKYLTRYKTDPNSTIPISIQNPEEDFMLYLLDVNNPDTHQRANVVRKIHDPGPRSAGVDIAGKEWTYVFEPLYNQLTITVDPRGNDPAYVPSNGGVRTPQRYALEKIFDYQEGPGDANHLQNMADRVGLTVPLLTVFIAQYEARVENILGLPTGTYTLLDRGDVNGDQRIDQVEGNVVQVIQPTVNLVAGSQQAMLEGDTTQEIETHAAFDDHGLLRYEIDAEGNIREYVYFDAADPNGDGDTSEFEDPETDPVEGHGYLAEVILDSAALARQLQHIKPRRATDPNNDGDTSDAFPFANLSTRYGRDAVGNVIRQTDPRGNTTHYFVNELNQIVRTTVSEPYSYVRDHIYDANNNVVQERVENRVPLLVKEKPQLDGDHNLLLTSGSPAQFNHFYSYDILDNQIFATLDASGSDPASLTTEFQYDSNENQVAIVKPVGNVVFTEFDERDLVFRVTEGFGAPEATTRTYHYDQNRNLIEEIDAEDNNGDGQNESILSIYDGFDRLIESRDAVGGVCVNHYDPADNLEREECFGQIGGPSPPDNSGAGNVLLSESRFLHDELSRQYQSDRLLDLSAGLIPVRFPVLADGVLSPNDSLVSARKEYDANGQVTFVVEDDGDVTQTFWDGVLREGVVLDAEDNVVEYRYDGNSNLVQRIETDRSQDPKRTDEVIVTTYEYDVLNRRTKAIDNVGNVDVFGFDSRDNPTDHQDAEGNTTHSQFDGSNRRLAQIYDIRGEGGGGVTQLVTRSEWDANSRLAAQVDDNGNRTEYAYDALDRKIQTIYGIHSRNTQPTTDSWSYDRDSNVVTFEDQNQSVFTSTFDGAHRRTGVRVAYPAGNPHLLAGTIRQDFEYDGLHRLTLATDENEPGLAFDDVQCTYIYDTLSRKLEETTTIGSGPPRTVSYEYQESLPAAGALDPTALVYPDGRRIVNSYDDLNRLRSRNDSGFGPIVDYNFIGRAPRVLKRNLQNGVVSTFQYDGIRRPLTARTTGPGGQLIVGFDQNYDQEDNRLFEKKVHDPTNSELYKYDSIYRIREFERGMLSIDHSTVNQPTMTPGAVQSQTWQFDGVGNWLQWDQVVQGEGFVSETREHSSFNEIESVQRDGSLRNFSYDDNGNQWDSRGFFYRWDAFNRLRSVHSTGEGMPIAVYAYDSNNRRRRRDGRTSAGAIDVRHYYYDSWQSIEEYSVSGAGVETIKYQNVWGATYIDELVARDARESALVADLNDGVGLERQFQLSNMQYSTFAVADEAGTVAERMQYDPFGKVTFMDSKFSPRAHSALGQEFTYTGRRLDGETGHYYYRSRYMNAELGRFLSRDTIGIWADPGNLGNGYGYVGDNPVSRRDPYGLRGFRVHSCGGAFACFSAVCKHGDDMKSGFTSRADAREWGHNNCPAGEAYIEEEGLRAKAEVSLERFYSAEEASEPMFDLDVGLDVDGARAFEIDKSRSTGWFIVTCDDETILGSYPTRKEARKAGRSGCDSMNFYIEEVVLNKKADMNLEKYIKAYGLSHGNDTEGCIEE